jgi:hypothetical protein
MAAKVDILTFEAGLVDELVEPRTTALNHGRGCRRLENLLALPQGPALTCPPSRWVAATKGSGAAKFFRVIYSETYAYLVEFGDLYCRFYTNEGQVLSGAAAYEIVSPYGAAHLGNLRAYSDAGTLYLVDGTHAPYRLVYTAATSWTLEAMPFTGGPFLDENTTAGHLLTPSGTTGSITLTASGTGHTPFVVGASGHVGAKWRIGHRIGETALTQTFTAAATSTTLSVSLGATWKITTDGTWNATLILEKTYDSGSTYETVAQYTPAGGVNFQDPGEETWANALYRLRVSAWTSGDGCKATLTVDPHIHYGYVTITAVATTTSATATVVDTLGGTGATSIHAEGAWSPRRGYPRVLCLFDNRLSFLSTTADPTTWWLSYANQYTRMDAGATAAHALTFTFTTGRGDPFLWARGEQNRLYVGTPAAVLEIAAADPQAALSATNKPGINRRIDFGTGAVDPIRAFGYLLMVDTSTLRPMKVSYNWEQDLLRSPPLNFAQPTLTAPGLKKVVFQRGPIPVVWWLRTDGVLLAMAFEQTEEGEIVGWSKRIVAGTDAAVEDIEVLPGTGGDHLWWIVARTVNGATVRHVERCAPVALLPTRATASRLDAYVPYAGVAATTIEGLAVNATTGVVTITATAHGFDDGDNVDFQDVGGMTWLNHQTLVVADDAANSFTLKTIGGAYVDGRLLGTYTSGGTVRQVENSFSGLDHLEGESVYAVADGAVLGPYIVASGAVTLPIYANTVALGLHVDWWLQPLRVVLPLPDGSSRGRQANVVHLWLSLYRSWGLRYGPNAARMRELTCWTPERARAAGATPIPELVTDDFLVPVDGSLTADPTILLQGHLPLPACVRALMLETGLGGTKTFQG